MVTAEKPAEPVGVAFAAGALMAGGPVWHYLLVNHYPLTRPEAVVLPLTAALIGGAIACVAWRLGGWIGTVLFAGLLYVFVDLQFDLHVQVPSAALIIGCVVLSRLLQAHRARLAVITLGVFYLAALPGFVQRTEYSAREAIRPGSSLPLVVHVILDEQWGIGGLRAAGDTATAEFLEEFYTDRGFEVYPAAYSRWAQTLASIPDVLNLGQPYALDSVSPRRFRPKHNLYFERLRQRGYEIRVHQSTLLDYCRTARAEVVSCAEVDGNSIANLAYYRGPWTRRALIVSRYFLNVASHAYTKLHHDPTVWRRAVAGGGLRQLDRVRDEIASGPAKGTAFFIHALLPHRPLEVDAQCRAYANPGQRVGYDDGVGASDSLFRAHLGLYAAQTRCAHRAVAAVLDAIDSIAGRGSSIVIVHGDHGSRMSQEDLEEMTVARYDEQQLNAVFPTLLAIRRPGVPAAVHPEPVPAQEFLWHLVASDFKGDPPPVWSHFVGTRPSAITVSDTIRELDVDEMIWAGEFGAGTAKEWTESRRTSRSVEH
ncbi:MAG TPA: hypothetical protein VFZ69_08035 [Longimicrobiales bacterium]